MKSSFTTRLAAACASVGTTFVMLWAVVSLAGPSAEPATEVAQPPATAPVVVAAARDR